MRKIRAYLVLVVLVLFLAYYGVYGFYTALADQIGAGWALAGSVLIALGGVVIVIAGVVMIESRPPEVDGPPGS